MLQTAVGKGVNDIILKSLPEGGEKSFEGLSESNSVWLQYSLTNKGRSQIPPIENNQNPQARKKKSFLYSLETNIIVLRGLGKALGHQNMCVCTHIRGFPSGSGFKNLPAMLESKEIHLRSLGQEDPQEDGMATHSSILAWRIP